MTNVQIRTKAIIDAFKPITSNDMIRKGKAIERFNIDIERFNNGLPTDSGLYGKVNEILGQSKHSKTKDVHSSNEIDGYIFIDDIRYSLEHKTNYTDIDKWFNKPIEWQKTHYIRYTIDDITKAVTNKKTGHTTPSKRLYFDGVLTFYDLFTIGDKFNAIKPHKTSAGEMHIYFRHSLRLCKYLNSLDIVSFERNGRYTFDDFIIE